jgi:cell division inhibitor SulA
MQLDQLIDNRQLWRAGQWQNNTQDAIATGYSQLDRLLAGNGLPLGSLTEFMTDHDSTGALRLLLRSLATLSQQGRWIAFIAPPHLPCASTLVAYGIDVSKLLLIHPKNDADTLWAMEQALRAGTCGAVLAWPGQVNERQLRRIQLAAEEGHAIGMLFHQHNSQQLSSSPAALRLKVSPRVEGVQIDILKRRAGWPTGPININWTQPHGNEHTALAMPISATTVPGSLQTFAQ